MAVMLGGIVEVATLQPEPEEAPGRAGDVRVRWRASPTWKSQALVALAGPAAEMVYRQELLHPGFVEEWSADWIIAWDFSIQAARDEKKRLRLLEQISAELYELFKRDEVWNAVAALADELLAHETIYAEEIEAAIRTWIR